MDDRPRFLVLGPLEVTRAGRPVRLGGARQKILLATLLLHANRTVSLIDLTDRLWNGRPPIQIRRTIQVYIARLRQALGSPEIVRSDPTGYLIRADAADLDLLRFDALVQDAAQTPDLAKRGDLLSDALALWRGPACSDVTSDVLQAVDIPPLHERRLDAEEQLIDAELTLGRHAEHLPRLRELVTEHPLRERCAAQLMLALYRSGRQAEALETYRTTAAILAAELGVDPGPELQRLHQAVLTADPQLLGQAPVTVPAQLPADSARFTGRSAELDALLVLTEHVNETPTALTISAIDGMAGIGKTALAVHAAHRLAPDFPDGQLFIDLHGYTAGVPPVEPNDALDRMLRALGVPGEGIPTALDDRAAFYRSTLADRHVIIVLDNASNAVQVEPLLPGQPGCLVLITSRQRLTDLDTAHQLSLDVLPPHDAVALFTRIAGPDRLADTPSEAIAEVVHLCGHLPLALRIAAARLRSRPGWTPTHLAYLLRTQRLHGLKSRQRSISAAFELSYQHLTPAQQQMFRVLGVHPGTDIDPYAAAALADTPITMATQLLEDLVDAHLLQEPIPGRYQFHDLLRAYASSLVTPDRARTATLNRLLDHYAATSTKAANVAYPHDADQRPDPPESTAPSPAFDSARQAEAWLDAELLNLTAAACHAAAPASAEHPIHQSATLGQHLRTRGHYTMAIAVHRHALSVARAVGHRIGELTALTELAWIHRVHGRHREATRAYRQALELAHHAADHTAELRALIGLSYVHRVEGNYPLTNDTLRRALELAREIDNRPGEMDALTGLGRTHHLQGQYEQAGIAYEEAMRVARAIGHRIGELTALTGLGWVQRGQGRYGPAADALEQALAIAQEAGHPDGERNALDGLGRVHYAEGDYRRAAAEFTRALSIARATGHRSGELVALADLADAHRKQGQHDVAAASIREVLQLAQAVGSRNNEFEARYRLGRIHQATGNHDEALAQFAEALSIATELDQPQDEARALDGLAHTCGALSDRQRARNHWQAALDVLTTHGLEYTDDPEVTTATIRAHLAELQRQ